MRALANRIRGLWRRLGPGVEINRDDALIERWDATAVGPGRAIAFEGFGISFSLFIGRTPPFQPKNTDRTDQLSRWYAGEDC